MALSGITIAVIIISIILFVAACGVTGGVLIYKKHKTDVEENIKQQYGSPLKDTGKTSSETGEVVNSKNEKIVPSKIEAPAPRISFYSSCNDDKFAVALSFFGEAEQNTGILEYFLVQFAGIYIIEAWKEQYAVFVTDSGGNREKFKKPYRYTSLFLQDPQQKEKTNHIVFERTANKDCPDSFLIYNPDVVNENYLSYKCSREITNMNLYLSLFLRITVIIADLFPDPDATKFSAVSKISGLNIFFVVNNKEEGKIEIKEMIGINYLYSPIPMQFSFLIKGLFLLGQKTIAKDDICTIEFKWKEKIYYSVDMGVVGFGYGG